MGEFEASYSLVIATFQSALTLPSPSNPFADASGNIHVQPGNQLPGIPTNRIKLGAEYHVTPAWTVGGSFVFDSAQYYKGDESNQNPQLPGYEIVGVHSSYMVSGMVELFAKIDNLLNTHYASAGQYGDPTGVNAPGIPARAPSPTAPGVDNQLHQPRPAPLGLRRRPTQILSPDSRRWNPAVGLAPTSSRSRGSLPLRPGGGGGPGWWGGRRIRGEGRPGTRCCASNRWIT